MDDIVSQYENAPWQCLIDGHWKACAGDTVRRVDPSTGIARANRQVGSPSQMLAAIAAADSVQDDWAQLPVETRFSYLETLRDLIARDAECFAKLIAHEMGAPLPFARAQQVGGALAHLDAFIAQKTASFDDAQTDPAHRLRYEPFGVAALITPWNWPLNQVILKLGAAMAAGCTSVLKPSELTPLTALHLGNLCLEAGIPAGVINIVPGDGTIGEILVSDPRIAVVSFTGSTRAGRDVQQAAGLRPTILELGGKSPNLLFTDCNLETAVAQGVAHCFRNSGQSCNAASWMLVEQSIYDQTLERAASEAARYVPGGDLEIGPVISATQMERIQRLLETGLDEGARCIFGGPGLARPAGFFPKPTILADVRPGTTLLQEEIFGPVLTITPFGTEAEAIKLANSTPYGLAAYVQTGDPDRADRVSRALRAGMVQVNGTSRAPGTPFGGVDASGHGREAGLAGIRAFQYTKSISGAARRS
ncbi:aldehyde dehydrogenase family protein [Pontivivens insulae]|uniref:aldehyde dehydrogenase (NAD(+)) n=1 Tax=Pontivivens insulae TaxID=1639689 RepID=A0A2R8AFH8_9RHOB|nr:aldehyde dehydrogenase family protein [Pontivivens insulae]RED12235.1 aldehyde dehydrogenase (NAD+) [Pontivivens insulae]SPF30992.1 3-succinoylsemialdehyde-pyridine dehydrogenase [Pontivivens insulae]